MTSSRNWRRVLSDVRRHPWLHLLSVMTVTAALLVLGTFFLCHRNFVAVAKRSVDKSLGVVYLKAGTPAAERQAAAERLATIPNVEKVAYKDGGMVQSDLAAVLGDGAHPPDVTTASLFPELFELEMKPNLSAVALEATRNAISEISAVEEVDLSETWAAQYRKARSFLDMMGVFFVLVIGLGCALVIANFMGLRHQARKDEINVVRLFGGTQPFVFGPFLLEGVLEGLLGAFVAVVSLGLLQSGMSALVKVRWSSVLGVEQWLFLSTGQTLMLFVLGVGMASFGSLSVFLKFRSADK